MKNTQKKPIALTLSMVSLVFWLANVGMSFGQNPATAVQALRQRAIFPKPDKTALTDKFRADVIVLKFREGTHIRAQSGQFIFDPGKLSGSENTLLRRANLDHSKIEQELNPVNSMFQTNPRLHFQRAFERPEHELDLEKQEGELNANEELADLNLYYHIMIENAQPDETEQLVDQLNALDIVEIAYPQPISEPAQAACTQVPPARTPSFVGNQTYLNAAPGGIDARYAWTINGGRGDGVRVIDVETGWNFDHEDLPRTFYFSGFNLGQKEHGTAVLGVVAACENDYGVTGIVPRSSIGASSAIRVDAFPPFYNVPAAISYAAGALRGGDIIIIEQHAPGPRSGRQCTCNCDQFEYVAQENWQADFDAIRNATSRGIIVVEAAGNGSMDLDSPIYERRFDRSMRDSGAILVGAGTSSTRAPHCWTNAGSRVDVQGWGDSVMTLGYGEPAEFRINGNDVRKWYKRDFNGTSSASPIVAGAAAAIQGIRRASSLPVLNSTQMRMLLRDTGTPQATSPRQIGPLPNLQAALVIEVDRSFFGFELGTPGQPFRTVNAANNGAWEGARIQIRPGSYPEALTFSKRLTVLADGGTVVIGR